MVKVAVPRDQENKHQIYPEEIDRTKYKRIFIMSTNDIQTSCANCGKGEEDNVALKNCVACKMIKYCSRDCQKAHRPQHKKECRKRAAELHDDALFKQPPKDEDCPICFLRMPSLSTGHRYQTCCGKHICSGCFYAGANMDGNAADQLCPFCRAPAPETEEEAIQKVRKRVEMGDAEAILKLGCYYAEGQFNMPQDREKALELWHRSADLGNANSYYNIGSAYFDGEGVERDEKKAKHYWELAAMRGDEHARYNLGCSEGRAGNIERALKHFMIAVESGYHDSLTTIKKQYTFGLATNDDYEKALQAYQSYLSEIKSDDRDIAAALGDEYKYHE